MKRFSAVLFLMFVFVFPCRGMAVGEAAGREGLTRIAEGVYAYLDEKNPLPARSFGANAGIIVGRDGVVVVDTLISSKEALRFIRDIRTVTDKPIRYVVNTHEHLDHSLGNSEFVSFGAPLIAHKNCKKNAEAAAPTILQKAQNYGLTTEMLQGTRVVAPVLTFSNWMEIDLGDRKVELIYAGSSHTDGSIVVYIPDAKTLFAGDVLFTNFHPNMRDADIPGWEKVLDSILSMDVTTIVPGHGPLSAKKDIQDMKQYLVACEKLGRELAAQGKDAKYIADAILRSVPKRPFFEMFVEGNVTAQYLTPK